MGAAALRARYLGDTVATASPQQLLVMLYDRLAMDLERGETALRSGDTDEGSKQLLHAQDIVAELHGSLKVEVWDGGPRLAALYTWLLTELVNANVKRDANRVASCRQVVEPLRDAWRQAATAVSGSPA